jgi:Predicted RNA-binding protein (contains KH domain)
MTKLVETIAKSLVDNPDKVLVTETDDSNGSVLQLQVAGSDMGKVIGKQGRIAKALRTVVKAAATKEKKKVVVEIVSEEELQEQANAAAAQETEEN